MSAQTLILVALVALLVPATTWAVHRDLALAVARRRARERRALPRQVAQAVALGLAMGKAARAAQDMERSMAKVQEAMAKAGPTLAELADRFRQGTHDSPGGVDLSADTHNPFRRTR